MRSGSGLRHGSIFASLRPNPLLVSALAGDDPRFGRPRDSGSRPPAHRPGDFVIPATRETLSPFVPASDDSEPFDADPSGTSLVVPDRLAGDQPVCSLYASRWPVRALSTSAWPLCGPARRRQRGLVGRGDLGVARRSWPSASPRGGLCAARRDPDDAQARLSRDRPPQPRPDLQRPAMAQPRRALPTLPHDPRRSRTSPTPLVERLPTARARRPLLRSIQLGDIAFPMSPSGCGFRALRYPGPSSPQPRGTAIDTGMRQASVAMTSQR